MLLYNKWFDAHNEYETFENSENYIRPNISICFQDLHVHYGQILHDYSLDYLTFEVLEDNFQFSFTNSGLLYSINNGENWNTVSANTDIPVDKGTKILIKGEMTPQSNVGIGTFSTSGRFNIEGNIMSLLYGDNFNENINIPDNSYVKLFNGANKLISCENLVLPSKVLSYACYSYMFQDCTNLIIAPKIPAETMGYDSCESMFKGCTSLTEAPELPATNLGNSCYIYMFQDCTSLTKAPELPATTLTEYCYNHMFNGCTSLTTAPVLPATTLVWRCYSFMFQGCTNLNYIKAMFTTTPGTSLTNQWVDGVAESGTFVKNSAATWNVTGITGIPSGWTVETYTPSN